MTDEKKFVTYTPEEMDLLERFAGAALTGLLARLANVHTQQAAVDVSKSRNIPVTDVVAGEAYGYAHAMLKWRRAGTNVAE